jgi:hypothetical protein
VRQRFTSGRTEMHYVTRRSHRMQKHKFNITCPDKPFRETAVGPPEHEKLCVYVSCPRCTGMHYVTRRCVPTCFLSNTYQPYQPENSVSMLRASKVPECTMYPAYPTEWKGTGLCNVSRRTSYQIHTVMKNSVTTFRTSDAPECTTWPVDSTGCNNTNSA